MEKIKGCTLPDGSVQMSGVESKINEIIDWFEKLAESCIESDAKKEDRLKTLEDNLEWLNNLVNRDIGKLEAMAKFIMKNSYWSLIDNLSAEVDDSKERKSLQDLYDEQNEDNVCCDNGKFGEPHICQKIQEPTVKKADNYIKSRECEHAYLEDFTTCIYCGKSRITTTKPSVKECDCVGGFGKCIWCNNSLSKNKSQKIEEIISELYSFFDTKLPNRLEVYEISVLKSWLRDKLTKI